MSHLPTALPKQTKPKHFLPCLAHNYSSLTALQTLLPACGPHWVFVEQKAKSLLRLHTDKATARTAAPTWRSYAARLAPEHESNHRTGTVTICSITAFYKVVLKSGLHLLLMHSNCLLTSRSFARGYF